MIQQVCGDAFVQGSQVAVSPSGEVYVAWEPSQPQTRARSIFGSLQILARHLEPW